LVLLLGLLRMLFEGRASDCLVAATVLWNGSAQRGHLAMVKLVCMRGCASQAAHYGCCGLKVPRTFERVSLHPVLGRREAQESATE
jgi:hypothetical protein